MVEPDAMLLKEELAQARASLTSTQSALRDQQARSNKLVMELKLQLYHSHVALKRQKIKSDNQMSDVMSHLVLLEAKLTRDQMLVKSEITRKNQKIAEQTEQIAKLKQQNGQLLYAVKELYATGGMNGLMREHSRKNGKHLGGNGARSELDKIVLETEVNSVDIPVDKSQNQVDLEPITYDTKRRCSSLDDLQKLESREYSLENGIHKDNGVYKDSEETEVFETQEKSESAKINPVRGNMSKRRYTVTGVELDHISDNSLSEMANGNTSELSEQNDSVMYEDDDEQVFSYSSSRLNTVIDEEDSIGPIVSHSGQMLSMGSMPMLANIHDDPGYQLYNSKNRPHSMSSMDLISIQQQAELLARRHLTSAIMAESPTPPPSPSYSQVRSEMTAFQSFKTMFRRKGSKSKGSKKRSMSMTKGSGDEYSDALKKHFQKYDMS